MFSSFRINTRREGLGDCLHRFGSRLCKIYVTSRVGPAHTMPQASQLIFIWPFTRAVDLVYDRVSHCKVPRATKFVERSRSGHSNVQTRDVTRVLQSDWPAKILAHGSKMVWAVSQTLPPRVYPERTKRCGGSGLVSRLHHMVVWTRASLWSKVPSARRQWQQRDRSLLGMVGHTVLPQCFGHTPNWPTFSANNCCIGINFSDWNFFVTAG